MSEQSKIELKYSIQTEPTPLKKAKLQNKNSIVIYLWIIEEINLIKYTFHKLWQKKMKEGNQKYNQEALLMDIKRADLFGRISDKLQHGYLTPLK